MDSRDIFEFTADDLNNPGIDAQTLAQLAQRRPDLWEFILDHPKCYPTLGDWLREHLHGDKVPASLVENEKALSQPHSPTAERDNEPFFEQLDDQPAEQLLQAQSTGQFGAQPAEQQFPHAKSSLYSMESTEASQPSASSTTSTGKRKSVVLIGFQLLAIIAAGTAIAGLFLPAFSYNACLAADIVTYFSPEANNEGWIMLVLFVLVILLDLFAVVTSDAWVRVVASVIGIIVGALAAADSIYTMIKTSHADLIYIEMGATILACASVALAIFSVFSLFPWRRRRA